MSETRKIAAKEPGQENAQKRDRVRLLVAYRLAGLSALDVHYGGAIACAQFARTRRNRVTLRTDRSSVGGAGS